MNNNHKKEWYMGKPDGILPLSPGIDCAFCKHLPKKFIDKISCAKYPAGIPENICRNKEQCKFVDDKSNK